MLGDAATASFIILLQDLHLCRQCGEKELKETPAGPC